MVLVPMFAYFALLESNYLPPTKKVCVVCCVGLCVFAAVKGKKTEASSTHLSGNTGRDTDTGEARRSEKERYTDLDSDRERLSDAKDREIDQRPFAQQVHTPPTHAISPQPVASIPQESLEDGKLVYNLSNGSKCLQ